MKKKIISASLLTLGFIIGATALSAIAGTWTAPTATPPNGNVDAPVNVGDLSQVKTGILGLVDLVVTRLNVSGGVVPTAGQVLTALDANGTVGWSSVGGSSSEYDFDCKIVSNISTEWNVCVKINRDTGTVTGSQRNMAGNTFTSFSVYNLNITGPGKYSIDLEDVTEPNSFKIKVCVMNGAGTSTCSTGSFDNTGVKSSAYWQSVTAPF